MFGIRDRCGEISGIGFYELGPGVKGVWAGRTEYGRPLPVTLPPRCALTPRQAYAV
jgi:hypothetical protein